MRQTYLFRAFHGCFTGGIAIVQAQNREAGIEELLRQVKEQRKIQSERKKVLDRINASYDAVFLNTVYVEGVGYRETGIRTEAVAFNDPSEPWQIVWNGLIPFPEKDDIVEGKGYKIRTALYDAVIPKIEGPVMAFGTWMPYEDSSEHDFLEAVRQELVECTFENGRCIALQPGFAIIQGGGD
jgi:hypothetical protein